MFNRKTAFAALIALGAMAAGSAHASNVHWSVSVALPPVVLPGMPVVLPAPVPVYREPVPVYAPAPVYAPPPVVVYRPAPPVVYRPVPVVAPGYGYGYYGRPGWGHRYEERRYHHHHDDRGRDWDRGDHDRGGDRGWRR